MSEPTPAPVPEDQPSKFQRIKRAAANGGIYMIPSAAFVAMSVLGYKESCNNLEAAKVALELAKLPAQS